MRDGTHTARGYDAGSSPRAADADFTTTLDGDASSVSGAERPLQLVALEARGLAIVQLPRAGFLSIGRAEDCEVRLDDALVSRRHALLRMSPLSIEDCGSANGTLLGGERLAPGVPAALALGQAISIGRSLLIVRRAVHSATAPRDLAAETATRDPAIVVASPVMKSIFETIERLARGQINVLLLGETGVGKEVVAESIHRASPRRDLPLLKLNCASLAEALLESELFGHERGAFTGACTTKPGLIELADRGTVFLDEIGELSPLLQAKLLRLIEAREVLRVGATRPRSVDVRFLFATNRDLEAEVHAGRFRADLFFRLSGAVVQLPPLRERREEILPLAEAYLERTAAELRLAALPRLNRDARALLLAHAWPGNLRELRNVIERSVLLSSAGTIRAEDLALDVTGTSVRPSAAAAPTEPCAPPAASERERIARALLAHAGNQSRAAEALGIPRRTFVRKLAELGLPRPRRTG